MNATSIGPQLLAAIRVKDGHLAKRRLDEIEDVRAVRGFALDPNAKLTPSEMVVTARVLERTSRAQNVTIGMGFLSGLVATLLELPIDDLLALRQEHRPLPEVPHV